MRRIFVISWLTGLLCLSQTVVAQYKINALTNEQSTVIIDLGEGNQMYLRETQFTLKEDINQIKQLNQIIGNIQSTLEKISLSLDPYLSYKISYHIPKEGKPNLQTQINQKEKYYHTEGDMQGEPIKLNKDSVIIQYPTFALVLILKNLDELSQLKNRPLDGYIEALQRDFDVLPKKYQRNYVEMEYKAENNNLERTKSRLVRKDYLEISPGAGLSIIRDRFVPGAYANIGLILKDQFYIGLGAEVNFTFERDESNKFQVFHNTFLGGDIGIKLWENPFSAPGWLYIGLDKLAIQNGDFFDKNTYRLSLSLASSKKTGLRLSPQWYFGGKDKSFLGFRLGFSF